MRSLCSAADDEEDDVLHYTETINDTVKWVWFNLSGMMKIDHTEQEWLPSFTSLTVNKLVLLFCLHLQYVRLCLVLILFVNKWLITVFKTLKMKQVWNLHSRHVRCTCQSIHAHQRHWHSGTADSGTPIKEKSIIQNSIATEDEYNVYKNLFFFRWCRNDLPSLALCS